MDERCGFVDGWLQCDLAPGHAGLHQDYWIGGRHAPTDESENSND